LFAAAIPIAVNTQINRLSVGDLHGVFDLLVKEGAHGWQIQLTVPVGRAADEPDVVLQPHDLLVVFPLLAPALREMAVGCVSCGTTDDGTYCRT